MTYSKAGDIVEDYLKANGFDGLVHPLGCGCTIKGGLIPCDGMDYRCAPGYLVECVCGTSEHVDCVAGEKGAKCTEIEW
jgi:hypothetical protein